MVYTLLAANLALLTWNLQTQGPERDTPARSGPAPEPAVSDEDIRSLPLLAELDEGTLRGRAGAGPASPESPDGAGAPASGSESVPAAVETAAPVPPGDATPAKASAPPPVAAAPPAGDSGQAPPPAEQACLTIGPLDAKAPVAEIRAWIEARGAAVDVRSDERREVALYWIYFPPKPSREEAAAQVERMRAEGIGDVLVVPKGDMTNAVSLGVFSRTETRDRRLRELDAKGYQPSIAPRYRTTVATWIDVEASQGALDEDEARARWPQFEVTSKRCPGGQIAGNRSPSYNSADAPVPARRYFFSGPSAEGRSSVQTPVTGSTAN